MDNAASQSSAHLRVLLADDHPVVRSGIRGELSRQTDIEVVGEASNGDEALRLAERLRPDVLVLDISMPGLKATQVLQRLQAIDGAPRVLILTAYGDVESIRGMLQAGAVGYLLKDEDLSVIVDGVRAVARGRPWFSPAVARNLAASSTEIESDSSVASERLSLREEEVLRLLARGWSNDQIAQTLHISERTVRYHLGNIYGKLGVNGRGEAIAWAVRHGLADPE